MADDVPQVVTPPQSPPLPQETKQEEGEGESQQCGKEDIIDPTKVPLPPDDEERQPSAEGQTTPPGKEPHDQGIRPQPGSSTTQEKLERQPSKRQKPPPAPLQLSSREFRIGQQSTISDVPASPTSIVSAPPAISPASPDDDAPTPVAGSSASRRSRRINSAFFEELEDTPTPESDMRRKSVRRMKVAYSGGSLRDSETAEGSSAAAGGPGVGGSSRSRWREFPGTPSPRVLSEKAGPGEVAFQWERRPGGDETPEGVKVGGVAASVAGERQSAVPDIQEAEGELKLFADEKPRVQSDSTRGESSRAGTWETSAASASHREALRGIDGTSTARTRGEGRKKTRGCWASTVSGLRKSWRWFLTIKGFFITVYMLNIIAWGGMLFLLLVNAAPAMCHPSCDDLYSSRRIWIEIDSQILNALFCVTGFGLIPWRFRDAYFVLQYRIRGNRDAWDRLRKIREWEWDGKAVDWVIWLYMSNTACQTALAGLMWGMNRFTRPAWATGLAVAAAFAVAGAGGALEWWKGRQLRKERKARAAAGSGGNGDAERQGGMQLQQVGIRGGEAEAEVDDMDTEMDEVAGKRKEAGIF